MPESVRRKSNECSQRRMSQIHHRNIFRPADPHQLTWKQKKEALESHMFLEEKRTLDIKGRIEAGGNRHKEYTDKKKRVFFPYIP